MGRSRRVEAAGLAYHVLNRGNGRMTLFDDEDDYDAFERVMEQAAERFPEVGVLAYCVMPNHWHMVLYPSADGLLSKFVGWLTLTHTQRWHAHRHSAGGGHVYQGRYKSFPIEVDGHLATVCRYVERNPLRAGLVERAEAWRWSSLWRWRSGTSRERGLLSPWPTPGGRRPRGWLGRANTPQTPGELAALRRAADRGQPFGGPAWREEMTKRFGLEAAFRPRGRPRKERTDENGS